MKLLLRPADINACYNLDTSDHIIKFGTIFDFTHDTLELHPVTSRFNIPIEGYNIGQICDSTGEFAARFDGRYLTDRFGDIIELIELGHYPPVPWNRYYSYNGSVILPRPGHPDAFTLVTFDDYQYEPVQYKVWAPERLVSVYFHLTPGRRIVVDSVDHDILHDLFLMHGNINACRHANGRDWWILCPQRFSSRMHSFLLDPAGLHFIETYESGMVLFYEGADAPQFSPDGNYYSRGAGELLVPPVHLSRKPKVQIYRFDRCTGRIADPIAFYLPVEDTSCCSQAIFSPNSRYLYIPTCSSIWQVDLEAADVEASKIKVCERTIGVYDRYPPPVMGAGFLGRDGRIYLFDNRNNYSMSVIYHPDEAGLGCDARHAAIYKPSCTGAQSGNQPFFSLGPLDGSPCDTLGLNNPLSTSEHKTIAPLSIYPNPSKGQFTVAVSSQGGRVQIYDVHGQIVGLIPVQDMEMQVSVSLPAGVFWLQYHSQDGRIVAQGKVMVH